MLFRNYINNIGLNIGLGGFHRFHPGGGGGGVNRFGM